MITTKFSGVYRVPLHIDVDKMADENPKIRALNPYYYKTQQTLTKATFLLVDDAAGLHRTEFQPRIEKIDNLQYFYLSNTTKLGRFLNRALEKFENHKIQKLEAEMLRAERLFNQTWL